MCEYDEQIPGRMENDGEVEDMWKMENHGRI
jgi:hypothetical protein